ncbi:hypothetical protein D6789_03615, partial [Candidatus Woesearchaeota archaeon]
NLFGDVFVKKTTRNSERKRYTPHVDRLEVFRVTSRLSSACGTEEETALSIVQGSDTSRARASRLRLRSVQEGDPVLVSLELLRGETRKRVVKLWVENEQGARVSEKSSVTLDTQHVPISLTIPLSLKQSFSGSVFSVVAEGLGERVRADLTLQKRPGQTRQAHTPSSACPQTTCPQTRCSSVPSCSRPIASFYTRVRKPGSEGKLFARLTGGNLSYELLGEQITKQGFLSSSSTVNFTVPFRPGSNLFVLRVHRGEELLQERSLLVEKPEREEPERASEQELLMDRADHAPRTDATEAAANLVAERERALTGAVVAYEDTAPGNAPLVLGLLGVVGAAAALGAGFAKRKRLGGRGPPPRSRSGYQWAYPLRDATRGVLRRREG